MCNALVTFDVFFDRVVRKESEKATAKGVKLWNENTKVWEINKNYTQMILY